MRDAIGPTMKTSLASGLLGSTSFVSLVSLLCLPCLLGLAGVAHARTDVFVHGRNTGVPDVPDYWHLGYTDGSDGVRAFTGDDAETQYTYGYDSSQSWMDLSTDSMPVCQLTEAMLSAPGTDIAIITHSAGGLVALYMMAVAQNGWANHCNVSPAAALSWTTFVVPVAGPFRGSEIANAVYGKTGGNFLQKLCGTVAGSVSNLVFNEANRMTYALQTSYVNNNYASLTAYGSFSAIYENFGTGTGGDDGTSLSAAAYCASLEANNDGVVGPSSATGCARGTKMGTNCLPGGHVGWSDAVSHSSSRRNDYNVFAANVWANSPY